MSKYLKPTFVVVAVAAAGAAIAVATRSGSEATATAGAAPPPALTVTVATPDVENIVEWDEYTGRFKAVDDVEIRARVSGYLTEVAFVDGDIVEAGDLLFRIDPRPYAAALDEARAARDHAEAAYSVAREEAERGQRLLAQRALSQEEADRRNRELRQAEADLAAAEARFVQADLSLEFTEVRAPITGRISDNFVSVGNLIVGGADGGTLLTTVVSIDPIYIEFTASEADYLKYMRLSEKGSRTSGRNAAHPVRARLMDEDDFSHVGHLSFVDNQFDASTGTMRGRATMPNPDGLFTPGMFARIKLLGSGEYDAVLIPDTAVQTDQSQKFVWVATPDDTAERRRITLGPLVDDKRIVREGLGPDDRVIVAGTQFVRDDARLAPQFRQPPLRVSDARPAGE